MAWLDLETGVLELFAERSAGRVTSPRALLAEALIPRGRLGDRARSEHRRAARAYAAAHRLPCPGCGKPVTRDGGRARLAVYCSPSCAHRARQRRYQPKPKPKTHPRLSPEALAAVKRANLAAGLAKRWERFRATADHQARAKRKRAKAAERQRRYRARRAALR